MSLKLAQFCDDPPKISTKSSYPQKIFKFLKAPKNIEIQNFEPQKMGRAYVCVKISEYPPGTVQILSKFTHGNDKSPWVHLQSLCQGPCCQTANQRGLIFQIRSGKTLIPVWKSY